MAAFPMLALKMALAHKADPPPPDPELEALGRIEITLEDIAAALAAQTKHLATSARMPRPAAAP